MKDDHGDVKSSEEEVRQIWKEYFERLLNVEDGREAVISTVGMGGSKIERGREDERGSMKGFKENEKWKGSRSGWNCL